jgi:SAM-dependent methyltransferase
MADEDDAQLSRQRTLAMGLASTTSRKRRPPNNELYNHSLDARDEATGRELLQSALADREAARELDERHNGMAHPHAPRGAWRWVEGANYWLNTETGERSWATPEAGERSWATPEVDAVAAEPAPEPAPEAAAATAPAAAVVDSLPREHVMRIQSVAEAYGYAAALAANEDRDRAMTIELRRANNFIKDGPIRVCLGFWSHVISAQHRSRPPPDARTRAAPRLEVLDLCCGRGQDFDKYRRACRDSLAVLSKLVGVDMAGSEAAASALERWTQAADRVMGDTREMGTAVMMGGVLTADLSRTHAARAIDEAADRARWDDDSVPAASSAHLATCFFALHYFFRTEAALRNLLAGASGMLRDGGFLATTHADGEAIAAAFVASGGAESFRVGHASLRLHPATVDMLIRPPAAPSPFGWAYDYHLPNAVENVTEYLVHSPTRDRIAEEFHLVKLFDESALTVLERMRTVPFWREAYDKCEVDTRKAGSLCPETLDGLALYRVVIYVKSPLRADIHAARRFVRHKMGFSD